MAKNYDEVSVIKALKPINGIKVVTNDKTVRISKGTRMSNSISGKIDYLCNYKGYTRIMTNDEVVEVQNSLPVEDRKANKRAMKQAIMSNSKKQYKR